MRAGPSGHLSVPRPPFADGKDVHAQEQAHIVWSRCSIKHCLLFEKDDAAAICEHGVEGEDSQSTILEGMHLYVHYMSVICL